MSASATPFIIQRTQPIADPVTSYVDSTFTWGLCRNLAGNPSLTETQAGVQTSFASPCMLHFYDLYGLVPQSTDDVYTTALTDILMTAQPHYGIPGNLSTMVNISSSNKDNPAIQDWTFYKTTGIFAGYKWPVEYTIHSSSLHMTLTNNGNHTLTIKEYKCRVRKAIPFDAYGVNGFNFSKVNGVLQPHYQMYYNLAIQDSQVESKTNPSSLFSPYMVGANPFQNKPFVRYHKILGSRTIVLGPGQESKSYWKRRRPFKVNVGDAQNSAPWAQPGAYFFLYTVVPNRAYSTTTRDIGITGTVALQAEAICKFEVTIASNSSQRNMFVDYRQQFMDTAVTSADFSLRNPLTAGVTTSNPAPTGPS